MRGGGLLLGRVVLSGAFVLILLVPAWWAAGRIRDEKATPFFRLLCATGLALVGYVTFVNLLGRLISNSIAAVLIYLAANAAAGIVLWRRWPAELRLSALGATWRSWIGAVLLAVPLGFPQWLLAVSTPYWDEVACSGIYLTAANQFAEGVFPPRHNALPDITIKYHYAFTILSGTVEWLSGLSANVSTDLVSTGLWLFVFLFVFAWLRALDLGRIPAAWGSVAVVLGGGFAWLYLPHIEAYDGLDKVPPPSQLLHRYDAAQGWLANLVAVARVPSAHLRNADGSLSNLPWDIAAQFQQHAVSLGMALTLVAFYLFTAWQKRRGFQLPLLVANVVSFGVLPLAHAVFGPVAATAAGFYLLWSWVRQPSRVKFHQGLCFAAGVLLVALLHGGMLTRGAEYGTQDFATVRSGFGYAAGGLGGFIHWNLAGFGLPLLVTILAWCLHPWRSRQRPAERDVLFAVLTVFAVVSYFVPQLMFYSTEANGVEEFTEISKFFFCAHFAFALLSAYGVAYLLRSVRWWVLLPGFIAMAIVPLAFCYAGSFTVNHAWLGFYHSPYRRDSIEIQMGEALRGLKKSPRDVYFDASADERRHGYLSELLIYGGSAFTMTPSRFERTGIGFRLSEDVVARRLVENGRMTRLRPGAAEESGCKWFYSRPLEDMALVPVIVRSRFAKLVAEGYFVNRHGAGARVLYSIDKPTRDLDELIERYWQPKIISQTTADWDGDGTGDLIFFDYVDKKLLVGAEAVALPPSLEGEFVQVYVGRFPGDQKADVLLGRMADTYYRRGKRLDQLVEYGGWRWTLRDSSSGVWGDEYERWTWDWQIPLLAHLDRGGFDAHLMYRPRTSEWVAAPDRILKGPAVRAKDMPLPLAGRFLEGSAGDLGLWSLTTGMLTLQSLSTGEKVSFKWGGRPGDVLVPGDYDGDGYDQVAVWQRTNRTWYWRRAPEGPISQATFGSETGIPLPADYNHDGRVDLAYWEPREGKIYVSYTRGGSVDLVVPVPPHSLPAFVNMY